MPALALLAGAAALFATMTRRLRRRGFRYRAVPRDQPLHRFDPEHSSTFRVGARIGLFDSSSSTTTIDRTWLSVGYFFPKWIERSQVTGVRTFRAFLSTGFMFDTDDGRYDGVILWTLHPSRLQATLALYDWPTPTED